MNAVPLYFAFPSRLYWGCTLCVGATSWGITHKTGMAILTHICKRDRTAAEGRVLAELVALGTSRTVANESIVVLEHAVQVAGDHA